MARQPNYGFDKRRKEQARKEKQEQKRLRKLEEAKQRTTDALSTTPDQDPSAGPQGAPDVDQ